MRRILITLAVLALVSLIATESAAARKRARPNPARDIPNAGIVYGDGHAFFIDAPTGWRIDVEAGAKDGLPAVFYPRRSSWLKAPAVMYTKIVARDTTGAESLESFIAAGVKKFRSLSPGMEVEAGPPLRTKDGKLAEVRTFSGDARGNVERVAYVAERRVFVILVLTSKTADAMDQSAPAFESLVSSYSFFTENLVTR